MRRRGYPVRRSTARFVRFRGLFALLALGWAGPAAFGTVQATRLRPFDLLDNGDFAEELPAFPDAEGRRRVPWWETPQGAEQLERAGARPALRTASGEWARQPLAAYAPAASGLRLRGEVRGRGLVTLIDGREGRVSLAVGGREEFERFELGGAEFAAALGRDLVPRFVLELGPQQGSSATWRDLEAWVPLPAPAPEELEAQIAEELDWIFGLWLERGADLVGPVRTAFVARLWDVVTGETLQAVDGGHGAVFDLLLDATAARPEPRWVAAREAFLADYFARCLNPDTGLPRNWDPVADEPRDRQFVELARSLGFLIDLAERGPDAWRERAREAARRIGETVLAHGVLPDGTIAPKYRSEDAATNSDAVLLRRLDLPAQLGRLARLTGEERFVAAAREAVAEFEYTHFWPGSWSEIDPGFDDNYGHYGARAATLWQAYPEDATFRRIALGGFRHYAPLWRDALRLGGNVAADQVRCWGVAAVVARLEPAERERAAGLVRAAVRSHFKGEQYGNGAWGDVTIFGFDPQGHLQVGDLTGTPQNLLAGLATAYDPELASQPGGPDLDEVRSMFATVLATSRETYRRPYGYLSTRVESSGANLSMGSIRLGVGLVRMLGRL